MTLTELEVLDQSAGDLEVTYAVDSDPVNAEYDLRVELYRADGGRDVVFGRGTDCHQVRGASGLRVA